MFEGFETDGFERVELVGHGVGPTRSQITFVTMRVYYLDGRVEDREYDFGKDGMNYESLRALERKLNAALRARIESKQRDQV